MNDTYQVGAVEDGNAGGFGRVVSVIRELQAEGKDVRILHGGDFLYPSLGLLVHSRKRVSAYEDSRESLSSPSQPTWLTAF